MKSAEHPASRSAVLTLPPWRGAANRAADSFAERASALLWEDWLRYASPGEQAQMLELAQRQGFPVSPEIIKPGAPVQTVSAEGERTTLLQELLSGHLEHLRGLPSPSADLIPDARLAPLQRLAVRRALGTPDIALLRARPAAAAPVLADIAVHAARQGKRVLFVANTSAALDATLAKLQGQGAVLPVRLVGSTERLESLPPTIRAFTLDEQRKAFRAATQRQAEEARTVAEASCRARQAEESLWPHLVRLAQNHTALESQRAQLEQRLADVAGEVEREAEGIPCSGRALPSGPFALQNIDLIQAQARRTAGHDQAQQRLQAEQDAAQAELARLDAEWRSIEPLAQARQRGRWWTAAWWKALFAANWKQRLPELEAQRLALRNTQQGRSAELERLQAERQSLEERFAADRRQLITAETARRQQEWTAQLDAVRRQAAPLGEQGRELIARFNPPELAPEALTPDAVAAAQARWQQRRQQDEAASLFARQWSKFLDESAPRFLAQLPRYASLLAVTHQALTQHAEATEGDFDLVIVEEADRLLENDLLRLARKGRRWVLAGQVPEPPTRPTCFARIWQALHAAPARSPYAFRAEGDRLSCQLRPVASRDRQHLETERLADFPEIELRILNLPKARPALAQVVFAPGMTLAQAKTFIYRELEETALHPVGRNCWLEETERGWQLATDAAAPAVHCCELERGLHEHCAADGVTVRIEFDRDRGWQRPQVEDWVRRHLRFRDHGRTVDLT